MSLALAAFLLAPAPATQAPPQQETAYFACPAGFTFRAFTPTRPDGSNPTRADLPAGASCTRQRMVGAAICPPGFKLRSARGLDQCESLGTVSRNGSIGAVSDGTSNTVIISETPPTTTSAAGNLKQIGVGAIPQPGCGASGTVIIDARGVIDHCLVTEARPPSERVATTTLLPLVEPGSTTSDF